MILHNIHRSERGIDILHRAVVMAAIHDSAESFPQPKCHPETRTKMLQDLRNWALNRTRDKIGMRSNILWLYGPAGAGKSAIMQTLADQLADAGRLGGSFFFKRGHATRGNANSLFTTIAYQLALNIAWLRTAISQIVENNPSILGQTLKTQLQKLIFEPSCTGENHNPIPIIIDGLDECQGDVIQEEILRVIKNFCSESTIPLRFIIASRPEAHIQRMFHSAFYHRAYRPMNVEQSFDDVRKYLCDQFSRIHDQHDAMANIPLPWPPPPVLEELVRNSSGYFIYAATIVKFIGDDDYRPTERLRMIQDGSRTDCRLPFDSLDQLYMTILHAAPRPSELLPILCAIANFDVTARIVDRALGFTDGDTRLVLRRLHSVLYVPSNDEYWHISPYHASFADFLNSHSRSQNFYIGDSQLRMDLACSFLKLFAGPYRGQFIDRPAGSDKNNLWGSRPKRAPKREFMPFLISLPPTPELCTLIHLMNPGYIFEFLFDLRLIPSWLKKMPRPPHELIKLWEDYAYMFSFMRSLPHPMPNRQHHVSQRDPELLRIGLANFILQLEQPTPVMDTEQRPTLRQVHLLSKITWSELRAIICSCRPISADTQLFLGSAKNMLDPLEKAYDRQSLSRDFARQLIGLLHTDVSDESDL
ncbi:NACHT domain-containing protein [Mycena sanguinolenta]|uniref:NACHT domain-containing protein n=1 Tax=Mycena sanguinolenta TaxID=230812 RepID=A0A8H7CMF2_9AGAR|nr:NACHT domain-containing protein [Mycena sanguinolenta]